MLAVYLYFFIILFIGYFLISKKDNIFSFFNAKKHLTKALAILAIIVSLAMATALCFFGIDYTDTPFQLHSIKSFPEKINVTSFGTQFLSYWLLKPFDFSVLTSRFIGLAFSLLTLICPIITYYKTNRFQCSIRELYIIILGCDTLLLFTYQGISYNNWTCLIISFIFCISYIYRAKKNITSLILLSLLTAMAVAVRVPNVVIAPFLVIYLLIINLHDTRKIIIHITIFTLLSLIIYFMGVLLVFGSVADYLQTLFSSLTTSSSTGSSHSVQNMLLSILRDSTSMILFLAISSSFLITMTKSTIESKRIKSLINALILAAIAFMLYCNVDGYTNNLRLLENSFAIVLLIYIFLKKDYSYFFLLTICFIITIIGSDTGLLKLNTSLCLVLSLIYFIRNTNHYLAVAIPLVAILLYLPFKLQSNIYEDSGIPELRATTQINRLQNIHTTTVRSQCITEGCNEITTHRSEGYDVITIGTHRHIFDYITDYVNPVYQPWFSNMNDESVINKLDIYIKANAKQKFYVVLFYDKPDFNNSKMEQYLVSNNIEYHFVECK